MGKMIITMTEISVSTLMTAYYLFKQPSHGIRKKNRVPLSCMQFSMCIKLNIHTFMKYRKYIYKSKGRAEIGEHVIHNTNEMKI